MHCLFHYFHLTPPPHFSFPDCYAAEFGDLEIVQDSPRGVPLEHFITCIPGVNIASAQNGVKVVKWIHNKPPPPNTGRWAGIRDYGLSSLVSTRRPGESCSFDFKQQHRFFHSVSSDLKTPQSC